MGSQINPIFLFIYLEISMLPLQSPALLFLDFLELFRDILPDKVNFGMTDAAEHWQ